MKHFVPPLAFCIGWLTAAQAQMPPVPGTAGPDFNPGMTKLFGETQAFTADLDMQTDVGEGQTMFFPGKFAFDKGRTRYTLDLAHARGGPLGDIAVAQMELLGLATMIIVTVPEMNTKVTIVPGLSAYASAGPEAAQRPAATQPAPEVTVQTIELGRETLDGVPVVKNKNLITTKGAPPQEAITWNAPGMKNFPLKIAIAAPGEPPVEMLFKNVKFEAPPASDFTIPAGYTRYNNMQEMVILTLMNRMGGPPTGGQRGGFQLVPAPPSRPPAPPSGAAPTTSATPPAQAPASGSN